MNWNEVTAIENDRKEIAIGMVGERWDAVVYDRQTGAYQREYKDLTRASLNRLSALSEAQNYEGR